jgi:hypothetical protein
MHKTLLALVAMSSLGACVASVGPGPSGPPPREPVTVRHPPERVHEPRVIEGMVIDAETRQPIGRAAVDITSPAFRGEMTVNTGPDGRYRTQEIPRGEFGIRCRREGYEVFERKAVMNDGIAHIDFELTRKRR